jgi:chromosome segregation protein
MFKLQRLEITGFKSFADYTEIIFTGSGITAVVGPNGCGKSNVSDAISWVLGEQRAKSLRGEDMKDVIFQGTSKRQPGGMSEVILHLERVESDYNLNEDDLDDIDEALSEIDENVVDVDALEAKEAEINEPQTAIQNNGNGFHAEEIEVEQAQAMQVGSVQTVQTKVKGKRHWKPRSFALEFAPGEAVSVGRRLYRSGESEYLLNGKSCRLRDIQDLFAGTGLSGAHYALIEQGKIGQILSSKPSDRRNLIEEAAGISKFRTRQRAAETRLESAKSNLSRISDIVSEIDKQANSLRRQASKTRRYKILREEFRQLLRQTFSAEGRYLTDLVNELEEKLGEAVKSERQILRKVAEKDEAFREATNEARVAEENLSELRARHSENALERDRNLREKGYQTEQIENLKNRSNTLKGENESTNQRLTLIKDEIKRLEKEEKTEREEAGKNELELRKAEEKYKEKLDKLKEIEAEQETIRAEVLQHTAAFERLTEIERQLENTIERLKERAEGLRREGERAEETFIEHTKEAEKLEKTLIEEREKREKLHVEKQEILNQTSEAREELKIGESELKTLRDEFSRKKHRLETLQELEEKRAIYAPNVQKLFAEEKKIGVKFLGTLADKLNVDEKAELAIENLFGGFLQSVLVKTEEDARKVSGFLGENNVGRNSILVSSQQSAVSGKEKKKQRTANGKQQTNIEDFLNLSEDFSEILHKIFPREMSAKVVEKLENAKNDSGIYVTFEGDLVIGGKLFVSGKAKTNEKNTSLLAFKRELRELETGAKDLQKQIEFLEKSVNKSRENLEKQEDKLIDLQSFIVKVERELLSQEIQAKSLVQEKERAERHKKVVADETKQIETEIADILVRQKEAKTNAEKAEKARITASENLSEISGKLNEARVLAENENAVLSEKRTLAATSAERRRSAQSSLRRVEMEAKEFESRMARENLETKEIEGKLLKLTSLIAEIDSKLEVSKDDEENEQNELSEALAHLKQARENSDAMSAELGELNKKSAEARNERAGLEIRQTEAITKLRSLNEKCQQDLSASLIEIVESEEVAEDFDLEESKQNVGDLRQKLENFGAINMLALEELSEAEERLLFLTSQRQDIIDSIAAAEEALREIKRRSREKFREAFEAINENFKEFFQELFGGGRGEMSLLESEDILEAGIEIVAQPPGKRLQSILLLSGGEKAMTAIALVLGIFKYRPSPFCLLDEVDAPLDDANVGRFVNKIADMSEKTQFIVITHNKRTMEAARALYGVTMQEPGVSKLVSVRFE